jgi:hypothetical protein
VSTDTNRRLYAALLLSGGATLVLTGLALGLMMIGAVIGPYRLFGPRHDPMAQGLGLWLAPSTANATPRQRERVLAAWRAALGERLDLVIGSSLTGLSERGIRVVALPDARRLSEPEALLLEGFLRAGGGVLLTGAIGTEDAQGRARGGAAMEHWLQIPRVRLDAPRATAALAAARRGPLAAALAPGQRLALAAAAPQPGFDDAQAELRWVENGDAGPALAASRRLAVGAGRLVWLAAGPPELADASTAAARAGMGRLVAAAWAWAAREPFAEVLAPAPRAGESAAAADLNEQVVVRVERKGPQRSLVEVSNRDRVPLAGLRLVVYLNTPAVHVEVARTTLQQEPPEPSFDRNREQIELALPELAAGASRAYTFDVETRAARASD